MARPDIAMSPDEWRAFLEHERTAVLASSGRAGFPHLVAMWYVPTDDALLMWTYAKSQKAINLRRDPRASVLVEEGERYQDLRGVLIQAEAELVQDFDSVYAAGLALHRRYSMEDDEGSAEAAEAGVRAQAAKRVLIRFPYTHVASWDHRKLSGRH